MSYKNHVWRMAKWTSEGSGGFACILFFTRILRTVKESEESGGYEITFICTTLIIILNIIYNITIKPLRCAPSASLELAPKDFRPHKMSLARPWPRLRPLHSHSGAHSVSVDRGVERHDPTAEWCLRSDRFDTRKPIL